MYTSPRRRCRAHASAGARRLHRCDKLATGAHSGTPSPGEPIEMNGGINVLQLVLDASLFVKAVMLVLLVFSVFSWVIIFRKMNVLNRAMKGADEFEERFWSGAD